MDRGGLEPPSLLGHKAAEPLYQLSYLPVGFTGSLSPDPPILICFITQVLWFTCCPLLQRHPYITSGWEAVRALSWSFREVARPGIEPGGATGLQPALEPIHLAVLFYFKPGSGPPYSVKGHVIPR